MTQTKFIELRVLETVIKMLRSGSSTMRKFDIPLWKSVDIMSFDIINRYLEVVDKEG